MEDVFQLRYPGVKNSRSQTFPPPENGQNEDLREKEPRADQVQHDGMREQSPEWATQGNNMSCQILLYQDVAAFICVPHLLPIFCEN